MLDHPPNRRVTGICSPVINRSERETNLSPQFTAELQFAVVLQLHSPIQLYAVMLEHGENRAVATCSSK
jgi:hypothetical protein